MPIFFESLRIREGSMPVKMRLLILLLKTFGCLLTGLLEGKFFGLFSDWDNTCNYFLFFMFRSNPVSSLFL